MGENGLRIGPFRGLAPYLEQDASIFFGREGERKALRDRVRDPACSTVLVTGEAGVGKTSLVRAGLLPHLPADQWTSIYLECGPDWRQDLSAVLAAALQRPVNLDEPMSDPLSEVVTRAGRFLLAVDHLEQLLWLEQEDAQRIVALIDRVLQGGGKLVLVVDRGNIHALERLSHVGRIPEAQRIYLGRMDRQIAARVMEQTVLGGGGYMEAGLPELIAEEAAAEGPVLPAELQVVGHAALLSGATRAKRYSRAGGAQALRALYVERLVARAGGWSARRVLAMLTEQPNPREGRDLAEITQGCGLPREATANTLEALEREGLIARRDDPLSVEREPRYTIVHPYLLQSIRDTVAPVLRGRAQARLSLRRRIHERGVLRPDEMLRVWRYLGSSVNAPETEQLRRGVKIWALVTAGLVAVPVLVSLVIYAVLSSSSYIDTETRHRGVRSVVVRGGRPSLSFAFNMSSGSFGQVLVDTGLLYAALPPALQTQVAEHEIVGGRDEAAIPYWLQALWAQLPEVRRGALQILAGDAAGGNRLLEQAASSDAQRRRATRALALLSGDSPATQTALLACVRDRRPEVRRMAVNEARRLGTERALAVLAPALRDNDNQIRLATVKALRDLPRKAVLDLLGEALSDADLRVQQEALEQLKDASASTPIEVFEAVRGALAGGRKRRSESVDNALERLLRRIQQRAPKKVAAHLMRLVETSAKGDVRVEALRRLRELAGHLDAARALTVVGRLVNSKDARVRAAAIPLHARFGDPDEVGEQLKGLAQTFGAPRREAALMRRAAAAGLGLLRGRADKDRLKLLKRLLRDPDRSVRSAATEALVTIGGPGLRDLVKGIKTGQRDVALEALRTICQAAEPDRRVATTILATAWKIKRAEVRGRALGCARKLAVANPRLSLWLADQARLDKNPEVRRAAAEAVALAVKRFGERVAVLARYYLRQKDVAIVTAVAEAMTQTPPKPAGWIFREVYKLHDHRDPKVRAAIAPLLVVVAPGRALAARALVGLLGDPEAEVTRAATRAAGRLRPGPATRQLDAPLARVVAAARSRDAIAALGLAQRLGLKGPIERAAVHPEPDVRAAAVSLLARRAGAKQALAVLESALRDPEQALRLAALDAIAGQSGRLGEPAVALLVRGTRALAPAERWAAFEALGKVEGTAVPAAVRVLVNAAADRSEERRRLAMRSLGALAPRAKEAAQALVNGALDPAVDVRTEAQAVLAEYLGRHCPTPELVTLLSTSGRDALQRHLACSALAWSGRIHGTEALKRHLDAGINTSSPVVARMAARLALALASRSDRPEEIVAWIYGW